MFLPQVNEFSWTKFYFLFLILYFLVLLFSFNLLVISIKQNSLLKIFSYKYL